MSQKLKVFFSKPYAKIVVVITVVAILLPLSVVFAASLATPTQHQSTTIVPNGLPTPTSTPVPSVSPTPLTDTFELTATLDGDLVDNPEVITLPQNYIGTQYIINYHIVSTANQPITVQASVPSDTPVTGNQQISWDATTAANGYKVSLPGNGATGSMAIS